MSESRFNVILKVEISLSTENMSSFGSLYTQESSYGVMEGLCLLTFSTVTAPVAFSSFQQETFCEELVIEYLFV